MPPLRTELLLPHRIEPDGRDKILHLKIDAIGRLKSSIGRRRQEIADIDYVAARQQLEKITAILEDEITDDQLDEGCRLALQIELYEDACRALNDEWFTLLALEESLGGGAPASSRSLPEVPNFSWLTRAEVSARRAWIQQHEDVLREGQSIEEPFLCRVAGWLRPERKSDREYYSLIRYLHGLRAVRGEEWVLSKRDETPDFLLESREGRSRGAEMAEVPISQKWADEERIAAEVNAAIQAILHARRMNLFLYDPNWARMKRHLPEVKQRLWHAARSPDPMARVPEIGLDAELSDAGDMNAPVILVQSRGGEVGDDIRRAEENLAEAIVQGVWKKLYKENGAPRKKPSIRPCDLVLYPNGEPSLQLDRVAEITSEKKDFDHHAYFDRIWLVSESAFVALG